MSNLIFQDKNCPVTEYSRDFIEGMLARMAVSFHKYGKVSDAYPHKVNAVESAKVRLDKYLETGNTEYLIDASNFFMIEFMYPSHPEAFFKAEDSDKSPGRAAYDTNFEPTDKSNNELTDSEFKEIRSLRRKNV